MKCLWWIWHSYTFLYFSEICARLWLKIALQGSFGGKKKNYENLDFQATFLKQKRKSATKKVYLSLINLSLAYIVQLHISWKYVHAFHRQWPPKFHLEVQKSENLAFLRLFSKAKTEECYRKEWFASDKFGIS